MVLKQKKFTCEPKLNLNIEILFIIDWFGLQKNNRSKSKNEKETSNFNIHCLDLALPLLLVSCCTLERDNLGIV
uniref:Uncharacterized protein n=1 Tax=Noccaea caerulescens TaxID=107243 RepID=A0A1J3IMW7_NOCCA